MKNLIKENTFKESRKVNISAVKFYFLGSCTINILNKISFLQLNQFPVKSSSKEIFLKNQFPKSIKPIRLQHAEVLQDIIRKAFKASRRIK